MYKRGPHYYRGGQIMKMKIGTRIVFTLYILCVILVCAFLIAGAVNASVGQAISSLIMTGLISGGFYPILWIIIAAVFAIVGIFLLFFGIKKSEPRVAVVTQTTDGTVFIALDAIEELVRRFLKDITTVTTNHISIHGGDSAAGVSIAITLSVKPEVIIPETTQQVQEGVKYYVEKYSGITVLNVKTTVEPLKQNNALPR